MRDSGNIIFRESDHTYWLDGRQLPSVTQLLAKHGLSADLSGAPEAVVRKAGEHGTLVHEEIENFIKNGEMGISDEFQDFLSLVYPLAERWECEVTLYTDDYAGRADLIGYREDCIIIVDTKTGIFHENATAWQTSMYANALCEDEDDREIKLYGFDAKMDGKSRLVPLLPVSGACILAMLWAEKEGRIYNPMLPVITANEKMLEVERQIVAMENQLKALKAQDEAFKASLLEAMENARVTSFEGDSIKLTYVAPYVKTTLNTAKLKKLFPDAYNACTQNSVVGASLRLKVKEENNG